MVELNKLRWGILGPGKISKKFADDLLLVDGAILTAVASRSIDRAQTFAEAYKIEKAYGNYEELVQDPEVDIIYIGTPHNSHMEYAILAMEAGKHVLCEKPLGVNEGQVQAMLKCAQENQVFLMEALWSRFNPSIVEILEKLKQGLIGEVNYVNVDFTVYREFSPDSRMLSMELAGGSLMDMGVYPVFLSYVVFGYPEEIMATARFHETGADVQTAAVFKYKEGVANIMSGFASESDLVAKIHGTKGRIMIDSRWHEPDGYKTIVGGEINVFKLPKKGKGYTYEIEECINCISQGLIESPRWSHKNSLDLIRITDEIRRQVGMKYPFE